MQIHSWYCWGRGEYSTDPWVERCDWAAQTLRGLLVLRGGGGGRYSTGTGVGRCDRAAQTLTLFKTQLSEF